MKLRILFSFLLVTTLLFSVGCRQESTESKNIENQPGNIVITAQIGTQENSFSASRSGFSQVDQISIAVKLDGMTVISPQNMVNSGGLWSTTLNGLQIEKRYQFIAKAYEQGKEIFSGSTNQTFYQSEQNQVTIALSPTETLQLDFPKINSIVRPTQMWTGESREFRLTFQGNSDETVSYELIQDTSPDLGTFNSKSGNITLVGSSATVVTNYQAPTLPGRYNFRAKVTNSNNNSAELGFQVDVNSSKILQFEEFQSISTNGAASTHYFNIGSLRFLAVSQYRNSSGSSNIPSNIYKWNGTAFELFQSIPTNGGRYFEPFQIGSDYYFLVSNHTSNSGYEIQSKIYKWNGTDFEEFQSIDTKGIANSEFFQIGTDYYLAVANHMDNSGRNTQSKIYKWNGTAFAEFQSIDTNGAMHWEFFEINGTSYIVLMNYYNSTNFNIPSIVYKWNGTTFVEYQSIDTNGAMDSHIFQIGNDLYMAIANHQNGNSSYEIPSKIYRWNGTGFEFFQSIDTNGAVDWESFRVGTDTYLAVANGNGNVPSAFYKWTGSAFEEQQKVDTNYAGRWTAFEMDNQVYFAISNYSNGSTNEVQSKIYKAKFEGPKKSSNVIAFDIQQTIETRGATSWDYFDIGTRKFLAVSNYFSDASHDKTSEIFEWNGYAFESFQTISTSGGRELESFRIGSDYYLAVANFLSDSSVIYKWSGTNFVEFQTINTTGLGNWRFFQIGSESFLVAAHYYNGATYNNPSTIYKWSGTAFEPFQTINTSGAIEWESFQIGSDHYLAVANSYDDSSYTTPSKIYKWSGTAFEEFQSIETHAAYDWHFFMIGSDPYLAVANYRQGSSYSTASKIYKWSGTAFEEFQLITTQGALDWQSFESGSNVYLAVANGRTGDDFTIQSIIYRWSGTAFEELQPFNTHNAYDLEAFQIDQQIYFAVANHGEGSSGAYSTSKIYKARFEAPEVGSFVSYQSINTNGSTTSTAFDIGSDKYLAVANHSDGSSFVQNSKIYKWSGSSLEEFQSIQTNGASDWEFFQIGSEKFLAVANTRNDSTKHIPSVIYKWSGTQFEHLQSIDTIGAIDWEFFEIGSESYLFVANHQNDSDQTSLASKIYKWNGSTFQEFQTINTVGAIDVEFFQIGNNLPYLAVANYSGNSAAPVNSVIYQWNGSGFESTQTFNAYGLRDFEFFQVGSESYLMMVNLMLNQSELYKWNGTKFQSFQTFNTSGAFSAEFFQSWGDDFLAITNYSGTVDKVSESIVYKWDGSLFKPFQTVSLAGGREMESFHIGSELYFLFSNYYDGSNYNSQSMLYKAQLSGFISQQVTAFNSVQSIETHRAMDSKAFQIGADTYLAIANYQGTNDSYDANSLIYKWDGTAFQEFQSIATHGAYDWEFFEIDSEKYLVVANTRNSSHNINSVIYRWNGTNFEHFQSIDTAGGVDWEFFEIGSEKYLAIANHYDDTTFQITNSKIYKWSGTAFEEFQSINTSGAQDFEFFTIGSTHYLAVTNYSGSGSGVDKYRVDSHIYKWNGSAFEQFQTFETTGAQDWQFFQIGAESYLAVTNHVSLSGGSADSIIYKWNGSTFEQFQTIKTHQACSWSFFQAGLDFYLGVTNFENYDGGAPESVLYKWSGTSFERFQSFIGTEARDWENFQIGNQLYFAIASRYRTTNNIPTKIYKANFQ